MRVFAKNARIHSHERLAELSLEINDIDWDIVLFSETRSNQGHCQLDHGHLLWTSETPTVASGVAILLHKRHGSRVKHFQAWSDRVACLDIQFDTFVLRTVVVYMPHAGYSHEYLMSVYDQLQACVEEAVQHKYKIVVGGDFNTQLNVGARGSLLHEFAAMFDLFVANSDTSSANWTFSSSMGVRRRIDFILHSANLNLQDANASDDIDLGSDHRSVRATFSLS